MTSAGLSERIREEACRLGFYKIGITSVRPLPDPDRFNQWLTQKMHGEMRYIERQAPKRLDPRLVVASAHSMIVAALTYDTGHPLSKDPLKGKISRYAWGLDYHNIAKDRLELLMQRIRDIEPSAEGRCYVDTGPVMEKVWGAQTSLGWIGKHTNLITRNRGSWFFIGVMFLNLELECDAPEKDYCGKCRRCIQACPTGAIVAPYQLDATRCISYLTIENRASIPEAVRPLIGNRIYGCDDCQEVCPWNRFSVITEVTGFQPVQGRLNPELFPLLLIDSGEFKARFEGSPILRATRDGFVRNVAVAVGNSGAAESIPWLKKALQDPSPMVREHVEWALNRITNNE